ncbi:hypothetical protein VHEMI03295 [[Torrubiella] hemipterigena]|uniref:tripeptidyl-peptidase II n=1 Tax=[Torrubiella] hemipterigena TaxID=1531966 RepID=A0A0A1TAF3_9HYPO|nr:hypothetical protein VHEMI03295 [[Torrubiella] hemipterigena]
MKVTAIFLSAFVAAALGVPTGYVLHEKRDYVPTKRGALAGDETVPVSIALKQTNLDKGMDLLMDVSDPDSANYGNHYTQDQIQAMFAPPEESAQAVKRWLVDAGIPADSISSPKSQGWLHFRTTVSKLEDLLKTKYNVYEFQPGSEHFGAEEYHLPANVADHVDFIQPAVAMTRIKRGSTEGKTPNMIAYMEAASKTLATGGCDTSITPDCIKKMYGIPAGTSKLAGNELGMFESDGEKHTQADLDQFYASFATNIPKGFGPKENFIDFNGNNPDGSEAGGEAALDFQVSLPVVYPQGSILYQSHSNFDGNQRLGFLNQFLDAVDGSYCTSGGGDDPTVDGKTANEACGTFKPANVISFSYGLTEAAWPTSYLKRQCDEFMKLGLQGTSLVFASGDGGVAGGHGGDCDGTNGDIFNPAAPGSCPYVTSVGSTELRTGAQPGDPESATSRFSGGGGFSNIWTTPDYQSSAVSSYFANHNPGFTSYNTSDNKIPTNSGIYNRAGRGFPDVAAVGDNGLIVFQGRQVHIGGTSMSCPIFAAILNRINEERLKAGKKVIGFANPALYKNPAMFNDVTLGAHSGSGTCNGKGFKAVAGWDPITGLGTPRYADMVKYFTSL